MKVTGNALKILKKRYFALENLALWASGSASLRGVGPTSRRPARRAYRAKGRAYASESQDSLLFVDYGLQLSRNQDCRSDGLPIFKIAMGLGCLR